VVGKGFRGGGILAVLVFEALAPGEASIDVTDASGKSAAGQPVEFETSSARVVVK
jgi:hypothetical protein